MTQAVQYEAAEILVEGVNLSRDSHILQVEEEAIEEVKDFKARANACRVVVNMDISIEIARHLINNSMNQVMYPL